MDIQEILALPFDKALETLTAYKPKQDAAKNRDAYVGNHAILTDPQRATKTVGDSQETSRTVKYTKETIPFQKRIVNNAVTFLFGEPVSLVLNNDKQDAFELINSVWKQNKLDYFNKKLARDLFVECSVAELWHVPPKEPGKEARIRVTLLSKREGYTIYPHFDDTGDLDAFTIMNEVTGDDGKPKETLKIYTAKSIIEGTKESTGWVTTQNPNLIGKIPIVYYEQDEPEWKSVETQIERMEYLISNFADTNDYFGAPVLQVKGIVQNLPKKEDPGKVIVVSPEKDINDKIYYPGGAEYITWDNAPEAIKEEYNMLKDIIYGMTNTPDLSFSNVKGLSNLSGIAIRLMFSDALFKAKDKHEIFGPGMERRISIMKSIVGLVNVGKRQQLEDADIDIIFNDVLPEDLKETITAISIARGGEPIMSEETAVRMNPLVTDAEKDIEILTNEKASLKSFAESYGV
jgi:SPP1 family phage portal protein